MSRTRRSTKQSLLFTLLAAVLLSTSTCSSYAQEQPELDVPVEASLTLEKSYLPIALAGNYNILTGLPSDAYMQTFDGQPARPSPLQLADWDVTVHRRAIASGFDGPMQASHGADCGAPPASHTIQKLSEAVYVCKDHVMTAIYATDYGMIYLTPNRMVDFSHEEAVIRFDMSTLRTAQRDWIDLWITPYEDNLQLPLNEFFPDVNGEPRRALQIKMDNYNGGTIFRGYIAKDFQVTELESNWWTTYEDFLTPDARRRDTFELRVSRNHVKFGMPAYNFWWIDADIADLGWDSGVVQLGHHSYNPMKDCTKSCAPNTWHWDNVVIAPSVPFTIIRGDREITDATNASQAVHFPQPAPANAHLRFTGAEETLEVSFDGGSTWTKGAIQKQKKVTPSHFQSYWMPIPAGTTDVLFRKSDGSTKWMVRDPSIWAPPS